MPIPDQLRLIAEDTLAGRTRRAKVRTLLGYYNLKRRREGGLWSIRQDMNELGISTVPDFEAAGFDEQVRFIPRGAESTDPVEDGDSMARSFALETVGASGNRVRYRALLQTFDAYDRFLHRLVMERMASVFQNGQNPRRQDRDTFPFFVTIEVEDVSSETVETWLEAACLLGTPEPEADAYEQVTLLPLGATSEPSETGLRRQMQDLHEAMKAELSRHVSDLRVAMEAKVDEIRLEALRQLAKELNDEEAMKVIQEFDQEMRQKLAEREGELMQAYNQISLLTAQIEDFEEQIAEEDRFDPSDAYPTMTATVQLFANICANEPVVVADAAVKSALRSASTKRREVLRFLLTLREYAQLLYGGSPAQLRPDDWFAGRGYEYAQGDSESTRNKFGAERVIEFEGTSIQLEEHVTLMANTANCVSVYWWRDAENRRLVIGYVGPHLRTTSW